MKPLHKQRIFSFCSKLRFHLLKVIAIVEILVNILFSFYLTNTYIVLIMVQSRHCSKCFININSFNSQYTEISNNPYIRDKKTGTEPLNNLPEGHTASN